MRIWLSLAAAALLAMASAPLAQPGPALDGAWTAVSGERDGKSAADVVGHKLTFSAGKFTIERNGKRLYGGSYKTNPAEKPAQIDFRNTEGSLKGTWKGIYEVEGDTLKTCDNAPDMHQPRPTQFAAKAGSGYIFIVFRRDKS